MKFTIHGRIPSKKNSKRIIMAGPHPRIISSEDYDDWHERASYEVKGCINRGEATRGETERKIIVITMYGPSKARFDLTNKAESLMDLLVDNGVLVDDSWIYVPELYLRYGGVDKENPRAEIIIENHKETNV